MKKILGFLLLAIITLPSQAQSNLADVKIHTSAVCEMCKENIEHQLSFEKGVKMVKLDLETNNVAVAYNPSKTDEGKIRLALTMIGYDADSLKADPKAFKKLPDCCQKTGH